jgi:hypothetical protein
VFTCVDDNATRIHVRVPTRSEPHAVTYCPSHGQTGVRRDSAVKLVDDLAGESPVSADYPVGAVVISGDGTGDQTVGSLDVNALEGWT